jgi:uncharacterized membrane protein required for colicin V production
MAHTSADMLESIGTPQIIDISIAGAIVLLAAAGFWRGIVKELFISASLLFAWVFSLEWAARWGSWLGDQTSSLSTSEAQFVVIVAIIALATLLLGYAGCTMAGLPPADLPGRLGGLILGAANATFVITVLISRARQLVLNADQRQTLTETRIGDWLSGNLDWVMLALAGVGSVLVLGGLLTHRRRMALVAMTGAPPAGASGFKVRRGVTLAPEAEKIDGSPASSAAFGAWPEPAADTVPLTRVSDPSRYTDRPAVPEKTVVAVQPGFPAAREEVIRCVSCGERITENDRFCPRCGRLLISG